VSNLRQPDPFNLDLVATLKTMVENCTAGGGVEVRLHVVAPPPPLVRSTLNHLHMMARESVNNALQHAHATQISLEVTVEGGQLVVRISDNGRGLDVDTQTRGKSGHFGCIGMRERARKIGAVVEWRSAPGKGTIVEILLPLRTPKQSRSPGPDTTLAMT